MTQRTSKRLKAAADKAVASASAAVTVETKIVRKRATATTKQKTTVEESVVATTEQVVEQTQETKSSSTENAAWGALFSKAGALKKAVGTGGDKAWHRPKAVDGISNEVKQKIASYSKFDGVAPRSSAAQLKVVAWNVNGLRALLKKEDSVHFRAYVAQEDPDVLCLSETKIDSVELQKLDDMLPQYEFQYWSSAVKKGYAGTAVLSKTKPLSVKDEIVVEGKKPEDEGRFLALEYEGFWLVHTYVPNSGMKLDRLDYRTKKWDKAMLKMLQDLEATKPVVWCGDLNVAHQEIDIHDPKSNRNKSPGFTDAERESFSDILAHGFVDTYRHLNPEQQQYTYWSYRFNARAKNKGWRLDYFVVSRALLAHVETTFVRDAVTGSDHVPIGLELKKL